MYFDGSGDYLSIGRLGSFSATTTPLSIGTNAFTIEAWIYPTAALSGSPAIYANFGGGRTGAYLLRIIGGKLAFYVHPSLDVVTSVSSISINTWTHVAVSRSSGTIRLYINGILEASAANSSSLVSDPSHPATVGGYWQTAALEPTGYFTGYIEDLRVTKGVGRYFSPSSVTRSLSSNTELIRFPSGSTVAQILAVVGASGTNQSSRVAITSTSSGALSATDPSPNDGVTTTGGSSGDSLLVSASGSDISIRIASGGSTNAAIKAALEANVGTSALVDLSNPSGSASATAKTFLTGGADLIPGALGASVVGSSITVSVPSGTTNAALKTYLESVAEVSTLVDLSNPAGNAPTSSGPLSLQGGADLIPASFAVSVSGTSATISVPENTSATSLASLLAANGSFSALVTPQAQNGGNASTTGSVTLSGGQG
jgi:hypothetical protein